MADPYRLTLQPGTPEHRAFPSQLDLAKLQCDEEGFSQTIETHMVKFDTREEYTLLTNDYQYIVDLSILTLCHGSRSKH